MGFIDMGIYSVYKFKFRTQGWELKSINFKIGN
jgi:hypothetical protein